MKFTHVLICMLTVLGVVTLVGTVASKPALQAPRPVSKNDAGTKLAQASSLPAIGSRGIIVKMANPRDLQQQAIAKLLRVQAAPESRVNFFKTLIDRNELRFLGWHQEIVGIARHDGVDHITVRVDAIVTKKNGYPVTPTGVTKEVYAVKNNKMTFVRLQTEGSPTGFIVE